MQTFKFNPTGGPITVTLSYNGLIFLSYEYKLYQVASSTTVLSDSGQLVTPGINSFSFTLPNPLIDNDGRLLEFDVDYYGSTAGLPYTITISVSQSGTPTVYVLNDTTTGNEQGLTNFTQIEKI
jgi:hypothetical protein